jgi:hypothetical protein
MGDGKENRQVPSRRVNDRGGELAHGLKVKFRASLGLAMGACNARACYSLLEKRN